MRAEDIVRVTPQGPEASPLFDRGFVAARFAEGVDVDAAVARIAGGDAEGLSIDRPTPPADQQNLENMRALPLLYAVFATALALGALAHVSLSVVRRRRGDLGRAAVARLHAAPDPGLRGLAGHHPYGDRGCRRAPVGHGRGAHRLELVTEATPTVYVEPLNVLVLALLVPAALLLANVVAAWPGHRAARMPVTEVLRTE